MAVAILAQRRLNVLFLVQKMGRNVASPKDSCNHCADYSDIDDLTERLDAGRINSLKCRTSSFAASKKCRNFGLFVGLFRKLLTL